jgi:predicted amidophosphoribosyltransferase
MLSMQSVGKRVKRRHLSFEQRKAIADSQNGLCSSCKQNLEDIYQIDHIVPLAANGETNITNLHALCPNCHARKSKIENQLVSKHFKLLKSGQGAICFVCGNPKTEYFEHKCKGFYYQPRHQKVNHIISVKFLDKVKNINLSGAEEVL